MRQQKLRKQINLTITLQVLCCYIVQRWPNRTTTIKLNLFTNNKDKVPKQNKSNVVYEFTCPKCNSSYIGKTDRTLLELMNF